MLPFYVFSSVLYLEPKLYNNECQTENVLFYIPRISNLIPTIMYGKGKAVPVIF
jgi:hypothetical protein